MGKVVIMDHPLVAHKLTIMRDKNTGSSSTSTKRGNAGLNKRSVLPKKYWSTS